LCPSRIPFLCDIFRLRGIGFKELTGPSSAQCLTCLRIGKRLLADSLPVEQQDMEDCSLALMILRDLSVRYDTKHLCSFLLLIMPFYEIIGCHEKLAEDIYCGRDGSLWKRTV
jgi:hypothetical protein